MRNPHFGLSLPSSFILHNSSFPPMDWQAQYESGETPWDEGAPHPALLDFIAESGPFQGRILVPGCGKGHDVRAVSSAGKSGHRPRHRSRQPSQRRRTFPKTGNEEYIVADSVQSAPDLRSSFDWIVEHTCFCAIDPSMRPPTPPPWPARLSPAAICSRSFTSTRPWTASLPTASPFPNWTGYFPSPSASSGSGFPPAPSQAANPANWSGC